MLVSSSSHRFDFDFTTASLAYFNKYPNPFSAHVVSADTISHQIGTDGRLTIERLICKRGRLPEFVKPFLGNISDSWVLETTVVDPSRAEVRSCTRNLDHTSILKISEQVVYKSASLTAPTTVLTSRVSFESNIGWGVRERIEAWSQSKFRQNIARSRQGMVFVMHQLRERGVRAFTQMQLETLAFDQFE